METKEQHISRLEKEKKEIIDKLEAEIKKVKGYNFELTRVSPDCGAGIRDFTKSIAVSESLEKLIEYCIVTFDYTPKLNYERSKDDGKKPCEDWYRIEYTETIIL